MSSKTLSSLLNLATDPSAAPSERDKALRTMRKTCDAMNRLPGDFISLDAADDDLGYYIFDPTRSTEELHRQIARLEAKMEEEEKITRYLRHAINSSQEAAQRDEARLRDELEAVRRASNAQIAERDACIVERDARIADLEASLVELKTAHDLHLVEQPAVEAAVSEAVVQVQDEACSAIADQPDDVEPKAWTRTAWKAFERLAAAGLTKLKMARELTRTLGRIVTIACVRELMRLRWSPGSGRRFAMWGVA